jgi:predicted metal-dependent phosphoesterase TrpH
MKHVDLHLHTFYSDGLDSPAQVTKAAKLKGLDMIAICDHDNLRGYYSALREADRWGIELVPGVEISTIQHHLLALNFNPKNNRFIKFVQHSQNIQKEVSRLRVEKLEAHGIPINFDKVKRAFPNSSIGKYTILMTMLSDKDCRKYFEKNHKQADFGDLFRMYLSYTGIAGHVERKEFVDWNQAVEEVHKADGLAVIAHPSTKAGHPSEMPELLKEMDGVEVQPFYERKSRPFKDYAQAKGLFLTYGSDYHGSAFGSVILSRNDNFIDESVLGKIKR